MDAKVLVVEDELLIRWNLVEALRDAEGLTVLEAENGARALQILDDEADIAFVVTDIQMPGRPDGLALYREIKSRYPGTDILLASGAGRPKNLPAEVPYVDKPYDVKDILECIRKGSFMDKHCVERLDRMH